MSHPAEPSDPSAMEELSRRAPSKVLARVAASLPGLLLLLGCVALPAAGGAAEMFELARAAPIGIGIILCTAVFGAAVLGVALFFAGRGARVPVAASIVVASLPWLASVAHGFTAMREVNEIVHEMDPANRSALLATAISEALSGHIVGAGLSTMLFAGAAIGTAIAAVGQRAPGRSFIGIVPAGLASILLLAASTLAWTGSWHAVLLPALAALLGAAALALGTPAIGRDAPQHRSYGLGGGAACLAALALVPAAAWGNQIYATQFFKSFAHMANTDTEVLAAVADEVSMLAVFVQAGAALVLPVAGIVLVWGWTRARAVPASLLVGGAAALVAVGLVAALGFVSTSRAVGGSLVDFTQEIRLGDSPH